ncbi:MAG: TonB-dependent receptor, partial [Acidobacteria bacterium]|nr:TonB-dependent receptor [Acidobacteriota bacterium]
MGAGVKRFLATLATVLIWTMVAWGQSETGSSAMEGTVNAPDGKPVARAKVEIRSQETGYVRSLVTNDRGQYLASVLPVGVYAVEVRADGFAVLRRESIQLSVGQAERLDLTLQLAAVRDEVTISSAESNVDPEESATGSTIGSDAVTNLPIRGRNFTDLIQLTPGIIQESDRKGLVIAGQRSINSNIAIDGADFNDALQGNQRGGNDAIFTFPQTAIREFQVVRSGASAEVGRTGGGFVNAVTKSGTNNLRGELLYLNRNPTLTSPDAFNNEGNNQQNQFGGSVGGPLQSNRAFFFVGVEQNFLRIPYFVRFATPAAGLNVPSDILNLQGEHQSTNNPTALFARTDFILSTRHTLNIQYTYSRFRGEKFGAIADGTTLTDNFASTNYTALASSNGLKGSLISVLSPTTVNEFRGQVASDFRREDPNTTGPEIRVDNFGRFGNSGSRPRRFETVRYQFSDNLSLSAGPHRLRIGTDFNRNDFKAQRQSDFLGQWRFSSLADFLNGIPRRLTQTVVLQPEKIVATGAQHELALFIQDRVALSRNLTLTAGLRWEGQWNPQPPQPNPALPQTGFIPNDLAMWQPRLGLAWDASGKGRTILRLSAGLFSSRTPATLFHRVFTNNNLLTRDFSFDERSGACRTALTGIPDNCVFRGTGAIVRYPSVLTGLPVLPTGIGNRVQTRAFGFQPDFRNPQTFQTSANLDQQLGNNLTLSLGFVHSSAWKLQRRVDRNLGPAVIDAATGYPRFTNPRPNSAIGIFSVNESTAHATYDALVVNLQRRFARRYLLGANYTYSNNRDDDSNERNFSRETTLNPFDLKSEAGPSKQDVRHNFNVNGLVDLGAGFTVSAIVITRSGFPYTAVAGDDIQGDANPDNDRAVIGGRVVGRNSFRQPNFFNLDLRLLKSFRLGETLSIAVTAEAFNVTRAANKNFGVDAISIFGNTGNSLPALTPPSSFPLPGQPF